MKLLRLRVDGFGPIAGTWTFDPTRLNVVVDDNERGKSSLLAAITAALYGLGSDRRVHKPMTPLERHRPWSGGAYAVELEFEAQGRRWRVARDFARETVTVHDDTGREVTTEFSTGKGEFAIGALLLKLDASEFEKCALVRQGDLDRVVPSDDRDRRESTLRARLEGAVDSAAGDTNAVADAYVRDLQSGTTELASAIDGTNLATAGTAGATDAVISEDGRYVAFSSSAPNLVASDANGTQVDVFRKDLLTGQVVVVSRDSTGAQPSQGVIGEPTISADGSRVAFTSGIGANHTINVQLNYRLGAFGFLGYTVFSMQSRLARIERVAVAAEKNN